MELDEGKQFAFAIRSLCSTRRRQARSLKWPMQPGDIFNNELFEKLFTDNKDILPAEASPTD